LLLLLLLLRVDELWERREQLLADMRIVDPAAAKGEQRLRIRCVTCLSVSFSLTSTTQLLLKPETTPLLLV
jgi:hypothetical protein